MARPRKYTCNNKFFEDINSEEKAYWFGFIMADGCIITNHSKLRLQIKLSSKDKTHLEKFNESIEGNYPIQTYKNQGGFSNTDSFNSRITIRYHDMCHHLIDHGCVQNKSLILTFPNLQEDLVRHFIRGYFDGDGSIFINNYKNRGVQYTRPGINICGTKEFLEIMSKHLGYPQCIYKEKRRTTNSYSYKLYGNKRIIPILEYLYKNSSVHLDRKYVIAENIVHKYKTKQEFKYA